jgi:hypothetical protein
MINQKPFLEYLKPQGATTASMPNTAQSLLSQSLGNTQAEQLSQPKLNLPRWTGKQDFAPSAISQSLDNVNYNKQAVRNVASDDWFHINSRPNNNTFF